MPDRDRRRPLLSWRAGGGAGQGDRSGYRRRRAGRARSSSRARYAGLGRASALGRSVRSACSSSRALALAQRPCPRPRIIAPRDCQLHRVAAHLDDGADLAAQVAGLRSRSSRVGVAADLSGIAVFVRAPRLSPPAQVSPHPVPVNVGRWIRSRHPAYYGGATVGRSCSGQKGDRARASATGSRAAPSRRAPGRPVLRSCWRRRTASSERRQARLTWRVKTRSSGWLHCSTARTSWCCSARPPRTPAASTR
jgi:hypothetical protein